MPNSAKASPQDRPQMIGVPSTLFASFSSIALRPSPLPCAASISAVVGGSSSRLWQAIITNSGNAASGP